MRPLQLAVVGTFCGSVIAGWGAAELGLGSSGTGNTGAPVEERASAIARAGHIHTALTTGSGGNAAVDGASVSGALPEPPMPAAMPVPTASAGLGPAQDTGEATAIEVTNIESISGGLPEPAMSEAPLPAPASAGTPDPAQDTGDAMAVEVASMASVSIALPEPPMPAAMPVPTASAGLGPPQDTGEVTAVEVANIERISGGLPKPAMPEATPPAPTSARTPDPAQDTGDAMAVEVATMASVSTALPEPAMPEATSLAPASARAPDPAQAAGEEIAVEVANVGSISGGALPEPAIPAAMPSPASAGTPDPAQDTGAETAVEVADMANVSAALPEPGPAATPRLQLAALFTSDPVKEDLKPAVRPVETPNECLVAEICIDEYLWSLYEATPKVDTNKVAERIRTTVRKKGKTRIVFKTITKYVVGDFTWKDPIAAQRAGMSLKDYVIGGMDRGFKLKLYHALRAMDGAGLMPGITSAFRDDYRQSIATGNKAASDSSYHGGSRRGGYAYGLAADLVSLKGETRLQRYASSRELWKWIDAHEKELGIGRPYLDRDPPHVGPIDGKEYADKRGRAKVKLAGSATTRRQPAAAGDNQGMKRPAKVRSLRVGSI